MGFLSYNTIPITIIWGENKKKQYFFTITNFYYVSLPSPVDPKKNYFLQRPENSSEALKKSKSASSGEEADNTIQSVYENVNKRLDKQVGAANMKLLESAEQLFSTEKRTEVETKYLLKKAQHISSDEFIL